MPLLDDKKFIDDNRIVDLNDPAAKELAADLARITQRLLKTSTPPDIVFALSANQEANAFVVNGTRPPVICVTKGLLELVSNEDELAAVLAHELTHKQLYERYGHQKGDNSKPEEIAADLWPLKLLHDAGYAPSAMKTVTAKQGAAGEPANKAWHEYIDPHPHGPTRVRLLENALVALRNLVGKENTETTPLNQPVIDRAVDAPFESHIQRLLSESNFTSADTEGRLAILERIIDTEDFGSYEGQHKISPTKREDLRKAFLEARIDHDNPAHVETFERIVNRIIAPQAEAANGNHHIAISAPLYLAAQQAWAPGSRRLVPLGNLRILNENIARFVDAQTPEEATNAANAIHESGIRIDPAIIKEDTAYKAYSSAKKIYSGEDRGRIQLSDIQRWHPGFQLPHRQDVLDFRDQLRTTSDVEREALVERDAIQFPWDRHVQFDIASLEAGRSEIIGRTLNVLGVPSELRAPYPDSIIIDPASKPSNGIHLDPIGEGVRFHEYETRDLRLDPRKRIVGIKTAGRHYYRQMPQQEYTESETQRLQERSADDRAALLTVDWERLNPEGKEYPQIVQNFQAFCRDYEEQLTPEITMVPGGDDFAREFIQRVRGHAENWRQNNPLPAPAGTNDKNPYDDSLHDFLLGGSSAEEIPGLAGFVEHHKRVVADTNSAFKGNEYYAEHDHVITSAIQQGLGLLGLHDYVSQDDIRGVASEARGRMYAQLKTDNGEVVSIPQKMSISHPYAEYVLQNPDGILRNTERMHFLGQYTGYLNHADASTQAPERWNYDLPELLARPLHTNVSDFVTGYFDHINTAAKEGKGIDKAGAFYGLSVDAAQTEIVTILSEPNRPILTIDELQSLAKINRMGINSSFYAQTSRAIEAEAVRHAESQLSSRTSLAERIRTYQTLQSLQLLVNQPELKNRYLDSIVNSVDFQTSEVLSTLNAHGASDASHKAIMDQLKSLYPQETFRDDLLSNKKKLAEFIRAKHPGSENPVQDFLSSIQPALADSHPLKTYDSHTVEDLATLPAGPEKLALTQQLLFKQKLESTLMPGYGNAEYNADIRNPDQRNSIINALTDCYKQQLGPDPFKGHWQEKAYLATARKVVDEIVERAPAGNRYQVLSSLAEAIEAQQELSYYMRDHALDKSTIDAFKNGHFLSMGELSADRLGGNDSLRFATLEFLRKPATNEAVDAFRIYAEENGIKLLHPEERSAVSSANGYVAQRNTLTVEAKNAIIRDAYNNFHALPLEAKALYSDAILFPPARESERGLFEKSRQWVFDTVLPLPAVGPDGTRKYTQEEGAREAFEHHLAVSHTDERRLILSAITVANDPTQTQGSSMGRALKTVLYAHGPAGVKIAQAIYNSRLTPQAIKDEMADAVIMANKPPRWETFDIYNQTVPEEERAECRRVGKILGVGSYGITTENEMLDGSYRAYTLLKPHAEARAKAEFNRLGQVGERLTENHPEIAPLNDMIRYAEKMSGPETDMDIAALQSEKASQNYDGLTVNVEGMTCHFSAAPWITHGQDKEKEVGYKSTQVIEGQHFVDLPEATHEQRELKRKVAKAIVLTETLQLAAGRTFDHDRHGGQQRIVIEGDKIYVGNFDFGAMSTEPPTTAQKKAFAAVMVDTFSGILHKKLRRQSNADAGKEFSETVAKYSDPDIKDHLASIERGLLAADGIMQYLSPKDQMQVMATIMRSPHVDPELREAFGEKLPLLYPLIEKATQLYQTPDLSFGYEDEVQRRVKQPNVALSPNQSSHLLEHAEYFKSSRHARRYFLSAAETSPERAIKHFEKYADQPWATEVLDLAIRHAKADTLLSNASVVGSRPFAEEILTKAAKERSDSAFRSAVANIDQPWANPVLDVAIPHVQPWIIFENAKIIATRPDAQEIFTRAAEKDADRGIQYAAENPDLPWSSAVLDVAIPHVQPWIIFENAKIIATRPDAEAIFTRAAEKDASRAMQYVGENPDHPWADVVLGTAIEHAQSWVLLDNAKVISARRADAQEILVKAAEKDKSRALQCAVENPDQLWAPALVDLAIPEAQAYTIFQNAETIAKRADANALFLKAGQSDPDHAFQYAIDHPDTPWAGQLLEAAIPHARGYSVFGSFDGRLNNMVGSVFTRNVNKEHQTAALTAINSLLEKKGIPAIEANNLDAYNNNGEDAIRRALSDAIRKSYPNGQDKLEAFLDDVRLNTPTLDADNPLATYKSPVENAKLIAARQDASEIFTSAAKNDPEYALSYVVDHPDGPFSGAILDAAIPNADGYTVFRNASLVAGRPDANELFLKAANQDAQGAMRYVTENPDHPLAGALVDAAIPDLRWYIFDHAKVIASRPDAQELFLKSAEQSPDGAFKYVAENPDQPGAKAILDVAISKAQAHTILDHAKVIANMRDDGPEILAKAAENSPDSAFRCAAQNSGEPWAGALIDVALPKTQSWIIFENANLISNRPDARDILLEAAKKDPSRGIQFATENPEHPLAREIIDAAHYSVVPMPLSEAKIPQSPSAETDHNTPSHDDHAGGTIGKVGLVSRVYDITHNGGNGFDVAALGLDATGMLANNAEAGTLGQIIGGISQTYKGYQQEGVSGAGREGTKATVNSIVGNTLFASKETKDWGVALREAWEPTKHMLHAVPKVAKQGWTLLTNVAERKNTIQAVGEGAVALKNAASTGQLLVNAKNAVSLTNLAKFGAGATNFAGQAGLFNSFMKVSGDAVDYATHKKALTVENGADTTINTVMELDPLKAVTSMVGIHNVSIEKGVSYLTGNHGQTLSEIGNETVQRRAQFNQYVDQASEPVLVRHHHNQVPKTPIKNTPNGHGANHQATPPTVTPSAPDVRDYQSFFSLQARSEAAAHIAGKKIDGHDIIHEFNKIDWSKQQNRKAYVDALITAQQSYDRVISHTEKPWWVPEQMYGGDGATANAEAKLNQTAVTAALRQSAQFAGDMGRYQQQHPPELPEHVKIAAVQHSKILLSAGCGTVKHHDPVHPVLPDAHHPSPVNTPPEHKRH